MKFVSSFNNLEKHTFLKHIMTGVTNTLVLLSPHASDTTEYLLEKRWS